MPAPKTNKTNSLQEIVEEVPRSSSTQFFSSFFRCGDDDGRCCISQPRRKWDALTVVCVSECVMDLINKLLTGTSESQERKKKLEKEGNKKKYNNNMENKKEEKESFWSYE